MRLFFLIGGLCLVLVVGISGCGGGDATSSETQESGSVTNEEPATTADDATEADGTDGEGSGKTDDTPGVAIGDYEAEGPFSAVSGQAGNKKPRFTPSGQPAPKKVVTRELEVGSGPAAELGDQVSVYFAGAIFKTGQVQFYGWPPSSPSEMELGAGLYGKEWEKTIEGMKVGGVRQVILPSSEFAGGKPVDYVIVLTDSQPKSGP